MAKIIVPILKQIREKKAGSPGCMEEFAQTSTGTSQLTFDFYQEGDEQAWNKGHEHWQQIVDKMIWSFEQLVNEDWEEQFWIVKPKLDMASYPEDKGQTVIPVRWKVQGVFDHRGCEEYSNRINEGLQLFGKHYHSLWT
jgi:hypothetical protein